jgi:murein DD-endopeptidase MepM/ murein hydrolase activator NlpD
VTGVRELTCFPLLERYHQTSPYGYRTNPVTGAVGSFHRGVDYAAPYGVPVVAPYDGEITTGYEDGGAGYWSWVTNGPDLFKSFHHSTVVVGSGWVPAGTTIALVGSTGSSTGAHAHLELWESGTNIDPTGHLDRAPLWNGDDMPLSPDDLAAIEAIVDRSINEALTSSYTGSRALQVQGQPEVWQLVYRSGELCRRHIPTPGQISMLQYVDGLAGARGQAPRVLSDPDDIAEFLDLPEVQ